MNLVITILLLLCMIAFAFIFSAFYASMENITDQELDQQITSKEKTRSILERYGEHSYLYRNAFYFLLTMLTIVFVALLRTLDLSLHLEDSIYVQTIYYIASIFFYIVLAIFLPHSICSRNPEKYLLSFLPIFRFFEVIFTPLLSLMNGLSSLLSIPFGSDLSLNPDEVTEEEIISIVNEGHEDGSILASEAEMIQNVLSFDEKDAKDIMVHRNDIIALQADMTLLDAIQFISENHFSRYPVYQENLDEILGVIHIKDLLTYVGSDDLSTMRIREMGDLIRGTESVPETHGINTLFTTMQRDKCHMIIVVDEYGQTSGLVAMEDILEEIVGNIQDEHDDEHDSVSKVTERIYLMEGRTSLEEASEELGLPIEGVDVETLNGYLISHLGRVPKEHEEFTIDIDGLRFHVLDVFHNVIQSVEVLQMEEPQEVED